MNTKEKGDIAVGRAINHYISSGYEVCLPIGDKRNYDFIVEKDTCLLRVQVKFAGLYKIKNQCKVGLRITGGNQSYNYARKYGPDSFDELFVFTEKGEMYVIPWKKIDCRNEITIETDKYKVYKV
jgi:hypothetical protein